MATTPMNRVVQHLLAACGRDGMTDGELLTRFLSARDDDALAALVQRHGPMVWSVCCRLLRSRHDAEDAFQATFLVLVRKAATLPDRETVGNWLYGVARQTAVRMRAIAAKRGVRERQVVNMPEPATAEQYVWNDLAPVVDEELSHLPDKYRVLIVLCDLEGVTRKDVAKRLDIPEGTAASRLAAARAMLARRLARRGVVTSGVLLGSVLSQQSAWASVPTTVASSTIKAASSIAAGQAATTGAVSVTVAALIEGVLKAMLVSKLKSVVGTLMLVAVVAGGGVAISLGQPPDSTNTKMADPEPKQAKEVAADKKLEGIWKVVSVEDNDKNTLDSDPIFSHAFALRAPAPNARLTLRAGKFTLKTENGPLSLEGVYEVDPSTTPEQITLTIPHRPGLLLSIPGIYTLDGDNLTATFAIPASQAAGLAGKKPGVRYTLKRVALQPPVVPLGQLPEAKEAAIKEMQKRLEGSWQCVSLHPNTYNVKDVSEVVHTFKGDEWDNTLGSEVPNFGTYKLVDLDTSPKQIDFVCTLGELKSRTLKGIFMLDGDSLIMCFSADARPKSFEGNPYPTMKFKRQPPAAKRDDGKQAVDNAEPLGEQARKDYLKLVQKRGAESVQKRDAESEMQKRLEGTWKVVSYHENGNQSVADIFHTFKGGEWQDELGLRLVDFGTYKLVDLDTSPKQIDFVCTKGESKLKGIFMLDGDSLIVCVGRGDVRPKVFFTERGDPNDFLVTQYKRLTAK